MHLDHSKKKTATISKQKPVIQQKPDARLNLQSKSKEIGEIELVFRVSKRQ